MADGKAMVNLADIDADTLEEIRQAGGHVNVLVDTPGLRESDRELFFGPLADHGDVFILAPEEATWAHILAALGCFPSIGQARKNGWNKAVEDGFTPTFKVGKKARKFITALKFI